MKYPGSLEDSYGGFLVQALISERGRCVHFEVEYTRVLSVQGGGHFALPRLLGQKIQEPIWSKQYIAAS